MPNVSLFKNCHSTVPVEDIEFLDVLHRIKGGYWQDEYFSYRTVLKKYGPSAPETKKAKEALSCFIPSGRFSGGRKRSNLAEHSGILNIDIERTHNKLQGLNEKAKSFIEKQITDFLAAYGRRARNLPACLKRTELLISRLSDRPVYYLWRNADVKLKI